MGAAASTGPEWPAEGSGCCKPAGWPQHMPLGQRDTGVEGSFSLCHSRHISLLLMGQETSPKDH